MPSEDVVIEIELVPITSYDDPDDYLSWDETVIDEISVLSEEDKQYTALDFNQKLKLNIDITKFWNSNNLLDREEFESSNEDVIPDDALKFEPIKTSMGYIHGGSIVVDLKKVNPGTATIYFYMDGNNGRGAGLMRTFTVKPYGEVEVDTIDIPFEVSNDTSVNDIENMHINITDKEHIYGSNEEEIQSYTLSELNKMEGTFKYIEGHSYLITAMHSIYNEEKGA